MKLTTALFLLAGLPAIAAKSLRGQENNIVGRNLRSNSRSTHIVFWDANREQSTKGRSSNQCEDTIVVRIGDSNTSTYDCADLIERELEYYYPDVRVVEDDNCPNDSNVGCLPLGQSTSCDRSFIDRALIELDRDLPARCIGSHFRGIRGSPSHSTTKTTKTTKTYKSTKDSKSDKIIAVYPVEQVGIRGSPSHSTSKTTKTTKDSKSDKIIAVYPLEQLP